MAPDLQVLLRTLLLLGSQDGESNLPIDGETPELPVMRVKGENGEVYFNLDWQTRQANDRRQQTNESYPSETFPTNNSGDDDSNFSTFRQTNSASNPSQSSASNYPQTEADGNHLYQTDSHTNSFANTRENLSNHASNYSNNNYANNFQNDNRALNWLQNQPENLRERIVQMAEPRIIEVKIDGRIETRQISRFDELVQKMESLKLTPHEFANSLPLEEREAFLARFQFTQTNGGERLPQTIIDKLPVESKPLQIPENQGDKLAAQTAAQTKNAGNLPARIIKENTFGTILQTAPNKFVETPKNIVLADKTFNNLPESNSKTAFGGANINGTETLNSRVLNSNAAEILTIPNVLTRREAGVVLGGALINGAFSAVGEHEQTEQNRVADWRGNGSFYGKGTFGFSAGATGSLLMF